MHAFDVTSRRASTRSSDTPTSRSCALRLTSHSVIMVAKKPAAKKPAAKKPAAKKTASASKKPAAKRATAVKKTTATKKKPAAKKTPAAKKKPAGACSFVLARARACASSSTP